MASRDLQQLISMIEDAYKKERHPSLAATLVNLQKQTTLDDTQQLHRFLKNKYGPPTGQISRVVSKQLFEYILYSNESLSTILTNASNQYNCQPDSLSDDMLCRYFNST